MTGDWDIVLAELRKPYVKDIEKIVEKRKKSVFETYFQNDPIFSIFQNTPYKDTYVVYVMEDARFDNSIYYDIEADLRGLDLNLTSEPTYDFLSRQGVLVFPRRFSWGSNSHDEWLTFTDNILINLLSQKDICLIIDSYMSLFIEYMTPHTTVMYKHNKNLWKDVQDYLINFKQINFNDSN